MPKYIIKHSPTNPIGIPSNFDINPIELKDFVPVNEKFSVKRTYFVSNARANRKTGQHCHIVEKELFIVISGTATTNLDDGGGLKEINLKAGDVIWVPNLVWHGFQNMSQDLVLLALSNTNYNNNRQDYIQDYQKFREKVRMK